MYAASAWLHIKDFPAYDFGHVGPLVIALALMGLFWLPGFLWASWLHRREGFHWTFRCLVGFAWSIAVFAACTWPFLWYKQTMTGLLQVLLPVWAVFLALGLWCGWRLRKEPAVPEQRPLTASLPADTRIPLHGWALLIYPAVVLYVAVCLICAYVTATANGQGAWNGDERTSMLLLLGGLFLVGCLLWLVGRHFLKPWLQFTTEDEKEPSLFLHCLALAFVLFQATSATVFDRPDWDDCYYCALMLDYAQVDALNREEPTHREGFILEGHNRILIWELWGGILCKFSGLNPQALSHTLWPGLLALLAYAGYWQVVKECVPRRWVPLTMLGVCAFFYWGISSHHVMSNYLLVRLWQGKAVLIHLGFPLLVVAQLRFMRRPGLRSWLLLAVAVIFALAVSSSGIFLTPMLCSALCWAWLCVELQPVVTLWLRRGWVWVLSWKDRAKAAEKAELLAEEWRTVHWQLPWRRWLLVPVFCIVALIPAVQYGLLIRQEVLQTLAISTTANDWNPMFGFAIIGGQIEGGSWEIIWFLLLPTLALLLPRPWSTYPVLFASLMMLTWANPVLCDPIAQNLTNYWTYFRIYWMIPVWIGIGLTWTLFCRLTVQVLNLPPKAREALVAALVLAGLTASWGMPSTYVWGETNVGFASGGTAHHVGRNPMKMPPGLKAIAEQMLADPEVQTSQVRILCVDPVSNYLTPYDRRFRFVITRELYTISMADQAGKTEDGIRRHWVSLLLYGYVPIRDDGPDVSYEAARPEYYHRIPKEQLMKYSHMNQPLLVELLNDLRVKYAILSTDRSERGQSVAYQLRRVGFSRMGTFGEKGIEWDLWQRKVGPKRQAED